MKLFSKFVVGFGILVHQKIAERLNEEVDCDRQSSPPDEHSAELVEAGISAGTSARNAEENFPGHAPSGRN